MINYKAFDVAVLNETIGWKSAAGYLEGTIKRIDTRKNTACKKTLSDWVLVDVLSVIGSWLMFSLTLHDLKVRLLTSTQTS
jgi:hypothetical protein